MIRVKLLIALVFFFGITNTILAASTDFRVRTLVGNDTIPPTTPTLLTATPVTESQIDITWSASSDNFICGGYQVFRDAIQIATTTLTSYSDSGLTASTPYTYTVKAFDSVFNYSSTSNSLATSTLTPIATTTPITHNPSASTKKINLEEFLITPSLSSAIFFWRTSTYAQFELRWGRTTSYELGFVSHDLFKKEHRTQITDLTPGTVYEFELIAYNRDGTAFTLKKGQFKTLEAPDTQAPVNVTNLQAYIVGNNVHLSWTNPTDSDFSYVRIVRNYLFFPTDSSDGFLSYQGSGSTFVDSGVFTYSPVQYYTVFTYDKSGNVSSGAIVAAVLKGDPYPHIATTTDSKYPLTFKDIEFLQDTEQMGEKGLRTDKAVLVRIAYSKLPEHLKTITITFTDTENSHKTLSYLLRINKDKTYYEALIAPLEIKGVYPVFVAVYDFQTQTLTSARGAVTVYEAFLSAKNFATPFVTTFALHSELITVLFFFIVLCLLLLFFKFFKLQRKGR